MQRQQAVFDLLHHLKGIDPLKQLFWSDLNYDRVNKALSRRGWTDATAGALAEDPVLLASGAGDFHVVYSRLASDKLLLGHERPIVSKLLHDHPYALFVFSNSKQDYFHFLNVKYDDDVQKPRLFRRITVGPHERLRTASECIARLDLADLSPDLFGLSPLAIQKRHDDAFNVEPVTEEFFKTFVRLYHVFADEIAQAPDWNSQAGTLAQLLLDRMLFLYFIQKKGWLNQEPDYLYRRFKQCLRTDPSGSSFYDNVLYPLFLALSEGEPAKHIGAVPFLNGGLFEEAATQTQQQRLQATRIHVGNATFRQLFEKLLERFNFTVTEDTPLDIEVAIDPEMLGKIFESLILQLEKEPEWDLRKLTGSYYTPRSIVHFMCRESLKRYLLKHFSSDKSEAEIDTILSLPPIDQLSDDEVQRLRNATANLDPLGLREKLLACRICDPAVGSGAFPVAMLHEMTSLLALPCRIASREQRASGLHKVMLERHLFPQQTIKVKMPNRSDFHA